MDTIANMLTTILNAQRARKQRVAVPFSRFAESLAQVMREHGWLGDVRVQEGPRSKLILSLSYDDAGKAKLHGAKRLSRPGQRLYAPSADIPYSYDGVGSIIISTSQGLMDDRHARQKGLGGELICEVW